MGFEQIVEHGLHLVRARSERMCKQSLVGGVAISVHGGLYCQQFVGLDLRELLLPSHLPQILRLQRFTAEAEVADTANLYPRTVRIDAYAGVQSQVQGVGKDL